MLLTPTGKRRRAPTWRQETGFTLFEFVIVVVILAVLAAVAVPRFVGMSTTARIAAVKTAYGAVWSGATMANMQCLMAAVCIYPVYGTSSSIVGPGGVVGGMSLGYPSGMSRLPQYFGIKDYVQVQGFTPYERNTSTTEFTNDSAPDPNNCLVRYEEPYATPLPNITMSTTGC